MENNMELSIQSDDATMMANRAEFYCYLLLFTWNIFCMQVYQLWTLLLIRRVVVYNNSCEKGFNWCRLKCRKRKRKSVKRSTMKNRSAGNLLDVCYN